MSNIETNQVIDLASTWLASANKEADGSFNISIVPVSPEMGMLIGDSTLKLFARVLDPEGCSGNQRTINLDLNMPVAFDQCSKLYCWADSRDRADHRLMIRLRSQ